MVIVNVHPNLDWTGQSSISAPAICMLCSTGQSYECEKTLTVRMERVLVVVVMVLMTKSIDTYGSKNIKQEVI